MAIVKGKARQNTAVSRASEGNDVYLRAMRDGALFTADWKQALILEGRGFMSNVGSFTAPATGGGSGATVLIAAGPELVISVPTGVSILPLRIEVTTALPVGAADDDEVDILIAVDQDTAHPADGVGSAEVAYNLNTLHSRASACTVRSETTTDLVGSAFDLELAHMNKVFEAYSTDLNSSGGSQWTELRLLYEPKTPPIINGPAALCVFWGGTAATTAFCAAQWLELPSSAF